MIGYYFKISITAHRCTGWWAPSVLSALSLPVPPLGAALLYFREVLLSPQHMVSKVAMFLRDSSPQSFVDWSIGALYPSPGQLAAATRMNWTETWPLFPVVSILRGKAWEASEAEFPVCSRSFHREQEEETRNTGECRSLSVTTRPRLLLPCLWRLPIFPWLWRDNTLLFLNLNFFP